MQTDIDIDCARCRKRKHSLFDDPVGELLPYLYEDRQWCKKVIAIAHNSKGYDSQFILNRAILLKWKPELILVGLKILSMRMEHLQFLDTSFYLPMPLCKPAEAFGLSVPKSWYLRYFNTKENLNYIGPIPDKWYFRADEMSETERRDFMTWYDEQKDKVFDKRRKLEQYSQDDVAVLRQACQIFRRVYLNWKYRRFSRGNHNCFCV
jgi:hypothetical protein